jgi:LmeA-like phospholipid-binding
MIGHHADDRVSKIVPLVTRRAAIKRAVAGRAAPPHVVAAVVVCGTLAVSLISSAPTPFQKGFIGRAVAATTAEQQARQFKAQQVIAELTSFLRRKVTSSNGSLQLQVKPGDHADLGRFSEISLSGRSVQVKKKLQVSEFTMRARNVQILVPYLLRSDDKELHTVRATTTLRAVITENDLTASLARGKSTGSMGLRVKYLGDRIRVTGNWQLGLLNGPLAGVGKLRLAPDHKVYFDIISLKLNGAEVPAFLKTRFSQSINPLIDSDDLPFMPHFRSLTIQGTRAILTA